MKKLVVILFMSIAVVAVIECFSSHNNKVNALLLDNIEALAAYEYDRPVRCYGSGTVVCPISNTKVKLVGYGYSLE